MRIGIVLEDSRGLEGNVSAHFGQCPFFLLVDLDEKEKKIISSSVVPNTETHGGGGCIAVDAILAHKIAAVIAGGMGMGAQQKFAQAGVSVYGYQGRAKDAVEDFMKEALGGLGACRDHGSH